MKHLLGDAAGVHAGASDAPLGSHRGGPHIIGEADFGPQAGGFLGRGHAP